MLCVECSAWVRWSSMVREICEDKYGHAPEIKVITVLVNQGNYTPSWSW